MFRTHYWLNTTFMPRPSIITTCSSEYLVCSVVWTMNVIKDLSIGSQSKSHPLWKKKTPCSYMSVRYTTEGLRNKVHLVHAFITYRITRAQRSKLGLPAAYESEWRIRSGARTMAILCKCIFCFWIHAFMQTLTTGCVTLSSCCQLFKSEAPNLGFLQCNGRLYQSNGWFWIMAIRIRVSVWFQLLYAMILTSDPHVENSHFANTLFWSVWEPRCKSLNQMLSDKWRPNGEKLSSTCCFIKKHPCHI